MYYCIQVPFWYFICNTPVHRSAIVTPRIIRPQTAKIQVSVSWKHIEILFHIAVPLLNGIVAHSSTLGLPVMTAGAALWRKLRVHQIYGANTDVGKTIVSTLLLKVLSENSKTGFLKPVSTGPLEEADDR